ncbi:MAG: S1 family peptidase [Proteobacteria bacterium]|nr:MAG: S1 family peptidase [Pseudomonadota bacterium]
MDFRLAFSLSLLSIALLASPARGDFKPFIENGTPVARTEALAQTVAMVQFKGGGWCSATFLSSRTLLTAGHCAEKKRAADLTITLQNKNGSWEQRAASALTAHPQYSHRVGWDKTHYIRNDVAIIQLATPFSFKVRTVKLTQAPTLMAAGQWQAITDAGYGYAKPSAEGAVLRRGSMEGRVTAIEAFEQRLGLDQRKNAANQNACPGDSGGPVFLGDASSLQQLAVHSMADGCTDDSKLTYSELLWPLRPWITAHIQ